MKIKKKAFPILCKHQILQCEAQPDFGGNDRLFNELQKAPIFYGHCLQRLIDSCHCPHWG